MQRPWGSSVSGVFEEQSEGSSLPNSSLCSGTDTSSLSLLLPGWLALPSEAGSPTPTHITCGAVLHVGDVGSALAGHSLVQTLNLVACGLPGSRRLVWCSQH